MKNKTNLVTSAPQVRKSYYKMTQNPPKYPETNYMSFGRQHDTSTGMSVQDHQNSIAGIHPLEQTSNDKSIANTTTEMIYMIHYEYLELLSMLVSFDNQTLMKALSVKNELGTLIKLLDYFRKYQAADKLIHIIESQNKNRRTIIDRVKELVDIVKKDISQLQKEIE